MAVILRVGNVSDQPEPLHGPAFFCSTVSHWLETLEKYPCRLATDDYREHNHGHMMLSRAVPKLPLIGRVKVFPGVDGLLVIHCIISSSPNNYDELGHDDIHLRDCAVSCSAYCISSYPDLE